MLEHRAILGPVVVVALFGAALLWSPFGPHGEPVSFVDEFPTWKWDDADWDRFSSEVRHAAEQGVEAQPLGKAMVSLGTAFVGTAYVPQTLEVEGPERLVINFRGLDCVTFVENIYAMARFLREGGASLLDDRLAAETRYEELLTDLRYRDGEIDQYPSRLHYFTDWIGDNARRGLVTDITAELGGTRDSEPIDFMSTHTDAYRQLADPAYVELIEQAEERLTAAGRHFVSQNRIGDVAEKIQDGDIIAATSTVAGLDVAHTGLALWIDAELYLLHAPLVGSSVTISRVPLAERIERIAGQDGIMVARPRDVPGSER